MYNALPLGLAVVLNAVVVAGAPIQIRLVHDLLDKYDKKAKPTWDNWKPINVSFSMDLYQILEVNEPQQFILLNAWIIERWYDEFLYWVPEDYENISELRLPYDSVWLPDTTLYNSLVMKDDETRRLLNAKLTTDRSRRASLIELLYPTIYKFSCLLDLRFFPFDVQKGIDYFPYSDKIGTSNYLENEGWYILKTKVARNEVKYSCCPNKYTLLQLTLYLRRKPLFYMVNLIIPTSIITLIAVVGFFTTSSAGGMREEKVSLGITTLLSMSILMLMVSDQMPTTSTFIPLIGWFILAMIIVISLGTVVSSIIIAIQKRGSLGERLSKRAVRIAKILAYITCTAVPPHIQKEQMMEGFDVSTLATDLMKPSRATVEASKKWMNLRREKNGVAIISNKSIDPLIHTSNNAEEESTAPVLTPTAPLSSGAASDDDLRVPSDGSSRYAAKHNDREKAFQQMTASIRQNRQLAMTEYEWLASVVERSCFAIFVFSFVVITVGINSIGFLHWYLAGVEHSDR